MKFIKVESAIVRVDGLQAVTLIPKRNALCFHYETDQSYEVVVDSEDIDEILDIVWKLITGERLEETW